MTKPSKHISIWAGLLGCLLLLSVTPMWAQESGAEMWGRTCGRCHRIQPPNKYDADTWRAIMRDMAINARLTPQEEAAITEFLMGAARRPENPEPQPQRGALAPSEDGALARVVSADPNVLSLVSLPSDSGMTSSGATVFRSQCTACHGTSAKGNGPAAAALTPRPPNLTRSERVRTLSDEELIGFLSVGKGAMPGFGKILTKQELRDIVAWLQSINRPGR